MPVLSALARVAIAPCFADDGLLAGPSGKVLRSLRHWQGILPQLGLRLSSAVIAPAVAAQAPIDYTGFAACTIQAFGNYEVLRSDSFCVADCKERAAKHVDIVRRVGWGLAPHRVKTANGFHHIIHTGFIGSRPGRQGMMRRPPWKFSAVGFAKGAPLLSRCIAVLGKPRRASWMAASRWHCFWEPGSRVAGADGQ